MGAAGGERVSVRLPHLYSLPSTRTKGQSRGEDAALERGTLWTRNQRFPEQVVGLIDGPRCRKEAVWIRRELLVLDGEALDGSRGGSPGREHDRSRRGVNTAGGERGASQGVRAARDAHRWLDAGVQHTPRGLPLLAALAFTSGPKIKRERRRRHLAGTHSAYMHTFTSPDSIHCPPGPRRIR